MKHERRRTRNCYRTHAIVCLGVMLLAARAYAEDSRKQPAPRAMLLAVGGPPASAAPMNAVIHAALEELHVVSIVAAPGMDLAAVQLALDCVAQTPRCLKAVAAQERAQVVISPSLQRLPDALVLSVMRFDTREGELRRVVRRQRGQTVGPELLDSVPNLLRELFDLPQLPPPKIEPPPTAAVPLTPPPAAHEARGLPVGPLVLAGAGAVSLAAGLGVGLVMENTQKDYDRIRTSLDTKASAQAAVDARSRGKTEATAANVLFAVGGGALASGIIWLALGLHRNADKESTGLGIRPVISPSHLGVVFVKRGAGL